MGPASVPGRSTLLCPRCGASSVESEAGSCSCCGSSLASARSPMRMMAPSLTPQPQRSPRRAPALGIGAVRRQRDFERWMSDAPLGIPHVLGLGSVVAVGLAFVVLALNGTFHGVLFVCAGLGTAAFGVWRLVCFCRAPILNRVACVVDEREQIQRTRHGWRTRCYATFEFEDGTREEFPVSSGLAAALVRGDCGVLVTRDVFLLAFHGAGRS